MRPASLIPPLEPGKPGDVGIIPGGSIVRDVAARRVVMLGGLPAVLLISTLDATLVMTFGDMDQVAGKVRKVSLRHQSVHGELGETHGEWMQGRQYSALNSELCLWVYATGVELALDTYGAFYSPLNHEVRAEYYEGSKPFAELMGVEQPGLPTTYAEFQSYYRDMLGRLVVGRMAPGIAAAIFAAKIGWVPVSPLGPVIAAALMPDDRTRAAYALKWDWREQAVWQAFRVTTGAVARVTPPQISEWPHARMARERSAAAVTKISAHLPRAEARL